MSKTPVIPSGPLRFGEGVASGIIAVDLAFLCLLGVIAFHFPQYLTTPELRVAYDIHLLAEVRTAVESPAPQLAPAQQISWYRGQPGNDRSSGEQLPF